ncbi:MAG: diversity-generating retroelement protein Avd [Bryobacteraceae bacterium]|nr:diversity-generating retroelement protein Avd [Bryobacteraceae bacterium]
MPWAKIFLGDAMMDGAKTPNEPAVVVGKAYDLTIWLIQKVEHFPKSYRFSVGDRITKDVLDLLQTLVRCAYTSDKAKLLEVASAQTNSLRYLLRIAKDLHLMSIDSYGFSTGCVEEIGRMVGGWQKSVMRRA